MKVSPKGRGSITEDSSQYWITSGGGGRIPLRAYVRGMLINIGLRPGDIFLGGTQFDMTPVIRDPSDQKHRLT